MTAVAEEQRVAPPRARSHAVAEMLFRFRELGIVLALILVVAVTTIDNPQFLSGTSIQNLLSSAAIIALLAIGETIVVITRNVDLSIGSVLGISAYAVGVVYRDHPHTSLVVVFLVALAIGVVCGVVNGAIVTIARVPSLVVTLGTLYIIRGIDGAWAGGNQVNASMLPENFNKIGYGTIAGIPYLGIIAIVAVAIAAYAMRNFRTSRDFYAIGSDPAAARLAGIPVGARVFLAFVLSGAIAGLAGAVWLSYYGSVDAIAGVGYEFQVIAAVVVGGVAIFGGSGTVVGAALGALLLNTINSALVVVNVSSFWSQAVAGAMLLGAIAFDRLIAIRVAPALRARRRVRSA
jgi:rhamnose transport system permease protein